MIVTESLEKYDSIQADRLSHSLQNLTVRRIRFFIKYGPKFVELIDPKSKTEFRFTTVPVRDRRILSNLIDSSNGPRLLHKSMSD